MHKTMFDLLTELYPLHRTLNHDDNAIALERIKEFIGSEHFKVHSYAAGSPAWTWDIPKRFHVNHAYLKDSEGNVIIDYNAHPLHIVSYSQSICEKMPFSRLRDHLYYSEEAPEAIPWKYKYYDKTWGLSLSKNLFDTLDTEAEYLVDISTEFRDEPLLVGEFFIPGESGKETLVVTDICHPYQVNDSITGVVIAAQMAKEFEDTKPFNGIRFLFVPETIGTIAWMASHPECIPGIEHGMSFDCLGNNNTLTFQRSMYGDSYLDFIAEHELRQLQTDVAFKQFIETMSNDELVMSAPGIEIPTIAFHRTPYREYHSSADTPDIIDVAVLEESYAIIRKIIEVLLHDFLPIQKEPGLIFMSKYDLHLDEETELEKLIKIKKINQYINGRHTAYELSLMMDLPFDEVLNILQIYDGYNLITKSTR